MREVLHSRTDCGWIQDCLHGCCCGGAAEVVQVQVVQVQVVPDSEVKVKAVPPKVSEVEVVPNELVGMATIV